MPLFSVLQVLFACGTSTPSEPAAIELTVLAASSLTEALPKVAEGWKLQGGGSVAFSFDSSARLAKQVEAGAPVDLVFFADRETLNGLDRKGLLAAGTPRDLLGNSLVVVVPAAATWVPTSPADLASPSLVHLAVAADNVPAGKYARAALQESGVWTDVEPKVVPGDNVRTTLAWVTRGEAEAGIVYATDARAEPNVKTAFTFPATSHPLIVYTAAVVGASPHAAQANAFLAYCASPEGMAAFTAHGFTPLTAP
jgi:molybdate transport system substrate-binding protein